MRKFYFFCVLLLAANVVLAQTTVFSDDFSTNTSATYTASGPIGASSWSINRLGADWGGRRNTSPAQLELSNDISGVANVAGWVMAYTSTSSFTAPYNTTLSSNPGLVTWTFNIRTNRANLAGFGAGSYGEAFILASNGNDVSAPSLNDGYALVLGNAVTPDPFRFGHFTDGLDGFTPLITSNTVGFTDIGLNYYSVKITYSPSTNTWELFLRDDGAVIFADPAIGLLTSQGTAVNTTHTATSLAFMGAWWQGSTAATQTSFFDNTTVTVTTAGTPDVAISTPGIGATSEPQGATNVILQRYDLAVTTASATLNGLTVTTAGTYTASDLVNLKVRFSTDAILDGGDATLSSKTTSLNPGTQIFPSFTPQAIGSGTTGYVFVTADIAGGASPGNTINVGTTPFSDISFTVAVNKTGTDPVAAGGLKTIVALAPDVAISAASPIAGNINQNSNNNILYGIQLDVTVNSATLNSVSFTTGGTYVVGDLKANGFKLWINNANNLTGATQLGTAQAIVSSGGSVSFTGLSTVIPVSTTRFLLLTVDVAFNGTVGNTVSIGSTPFSSILFASGNKTGTDPVAAGNAQTITAVTPAVTLTQTGPTASNAALGATNVFLYQFTAAVTNNVAVLNSVTVTTGGFYSIADLVAGSFKLWYNTSGTFGTATQISSAAIVSSGNNVVFSGLSQQINPGVTGNFWVTVDVAAGATIGNTINITATPFSNISFATATLSGTDPMAAGGLKTFVLIPLVGEIVINQFSPDYGAAADEYVELVNKTNKSFDLSLLQFSYLSVAGGGSNNSALTGTLQPYSYWLLSPNATITVGATSALSRDGSVAGGYATAGQIALRVISTGTIIDGIAYGAVTTNVFGEGSLAPAPTTDGGLKRNEGDDTNDNGADITTVVTASIDLRNSNSRLTQTGATLPGGVYSRIYVKGNSSLGGSATLSDRIVLLSGNFSLGTNNLTTLNTVGGSVSSYIQTNGSGVLTVNNITGTSKSLPIGNSTYNPLSIINGSGFSWSARVEDALNNVIPPFNTEKAINRTWHISPSGTIVTGPDVTFGFDDADDNQLANPSLYSGDANRNAQFWHYTGADWIAASGAIAMTPAEGPQSITLSGYTYYSPFAIAKITGPLPVKFGNIRAYQQGNGIRIDWSNLTESAVMNYQVQRSANGLDFISLSTVNPNKNDGGRADYSYLDATPLDGDNFYRIQSLEANGRKLNSVIVRVSTKAGQTGINIYPNPITGNQVSFQALSLMKGEYTLRIFNTGGQQVFSKTLLHQGGALTEVVQLPVSMKSGMYSLVLSSGELKFTKSFIIR